MAFRLRERDCMTLECLADYRILIVQRKWWPEDSNLMSFLCSPDHLVMWRSIAPKRISTTFIRLAAT